MKESTLLLLKVHNNNYICYQSVANTMYFRNRYICNLYRRFGTEVSPQKNHYQNLNLKPTATLTQIKHSFKKLSMKLHPDILQSQKLTDDVFEKKKNQYLQIKQSYEILSDPDRKSDYDSKLALVNADLARRKALELSRQSSGFHYTGYKSPESPFGYGVGREFDQERYFRWNMANERRMRERKIMQCGDLFHHDLNNTDISLGIHKGLHQQGTEEVAEEDKKRMHLWLILLALIGTALVGEISYLKRKKKRDQVQEKERREQQRQILMNNRNMAEIEEPTSEYSEMLLSRVAESDQEH